MHRVFLSLGSNMGIKEDNLDNAVDMLKNSEFIHNVNVSSYYVTEPVGYVDQDSFINIAVELFTELNPMQMLDLCQDIEEKLHRKRIIRWGPRTIDVDIILFDDLESDDDILTLPHPRMHERGFVLVPLMELDDQLMIRNVNIKEIIKNVNIEGVRKICNG